MKKVITALFVAAAVSVQGFALEFILTPTIGYSNLSFTGQSETLTIKNRLADISTKANISFSMNVVPIGLAMGTIAKNGFTFLWNNDFAPLGNGTAKVNLSANSVSLVDFELEATLTDGFAFEQSFILGKTFKAIGDKLYINVASGLAWGIAKLDMCKNIAGTTVYSEKVFDFNFGIPIQCGVQFFFTKHVGLNLTIADVIALGAGLGHRIPVIGNNAISQVGFENVFTAKLGPVFKF